MAREAEYSTDEKEFTVEEEVDKLKFLPHPDLPKRFGQAARMVLVPRAHARGPALGGKGQQIARRGRLAASWVVGMTTFQVTSATSTTTGQTTCVSRG